MSISGQADAHTRQGQITVSRNMSDINAVHDVIEHIHQLGDDRWHRQLPQELSDGLRS